MAAAPVSRLYYRYGEGDDYEEELGDRLVAGSSSPAGVASTSVENTCACRLRKARSSGQGRTMAAREREPRRLETEKMGADHGGPGCARLGVGRDGQPRQDKHLPAIAAMLDDRQLDLIAHDSVGLVAIQGSAGSGKTTVGLHRVAYLGPRPAEVPARKCSSSSRTKRSFTTSRVLPSLGVEGVSVTTSPGSPLGSSPSSSRGCPPRWSEETPPVVVARKISRGAPARDGSPRGADCRNDRRAPLDSLRWRDGRTATRSLSAWRAYGDRWADTAGCEAVDALAEWLGGKRGAPRSRVPPRDSARSHAPRSSSWSRTCGPRRARSPACGTSS